MKVLVDATVWSLALRRKPEDLSAAQRKLVAEWTRLVRQDRAAIIGMSRQEVLSGLRHNSQFERLEQELAVFPSTPVDDADHVGAARCFNICRSRGAAPTAVDMLLCAVAMRTGLPIFTTDSDFERYAKHLPIQLHTAGQAAQGNAQ